jgi:hypothetical protein
MARPLRARGAARRGCGAAAWIAAAARAFSYDGAVTLHRSLYRRRAPMTSRIYVIRTPLRLVDGLSYGGPMRMKIARRRVAYAGFTSAELARVACRHWNVPREHYIEPWEDAVRHETPETRARHVLLFRDEADFRAWLQSPDTFDLAAHTLSLHMAGVLGNRRRSA